MTARCPQCRAREVRAHATLVQLSFVPRWWLFGRPVLRARTLAAECSCGKCLYAFVLRPDGISPAPRQEAYDALQSARAGLEAAAHEKKATPLPRPAPDPRARKR